MRLFLDSADKAEWERLLPLGFFHGVTTNPLILERDGVPCSVDSAANLLDTALTYPGIQEVMFQAWGGTSEELVQRSQQLHELDPERVVVKLPLTRAGIRAAAELRAAGAGTGRRVRLCMTVCYSATQGFVAAGLDAEYIAPYLGRLNDAGRDALRECDRLRAAVGGDARGAPRVLVASLRGAEQMVELAVRGHDTFTFSPKVCDELLDVEATDLAAADFECAALGGRV